MKTAYDLLRGYVIDVNTNVQSFIRFYITTCLDTRQPGTVFKKLDTRQSEILTNLPLLQAQSSV